MKIIDDLNAFVPPEHVVVTSGTFDGVHMGHRKILNRVIQAAKRTDGYSLVLTFWPHPRFVLKPDSHDLKLLTTFEEKASLLEEIGIDYLVKIPFTKEFSELSSDEFITRVLINGLKTSRLVIGYDHRFGKNREGGFDYLISNESRYGFQVEEIPRQDIDQMTVSSTKIRDSLVVGDLTLANEFLGRNYSITGFVKDGDRIGRSIGFPTANLDVPESYKLIPGDGAYAVTVAVQNKLYKGMMNIGMRPTVSGQERRIEVNIFNFDHEIYNERLTVYFHQMLRKERKFGSIDELKAQLSKDREHALTILK